MFKRLTIIGLFILFAFTMAVHAQEEGKKAKEVDEEEEFFWDRWGKSKWFDWRLRGNPYIELNYGISKTAHNSFDIKFNDLGLAEVRLGYRDIYQGNTDYLLELNERYMFGSILKKEFISNDPLVSRFNAEFIRFGVGNVESDGYYSGVVGILPYTGNSYVWTSMKKVEYNGVRTAQVTADDEYLAYVGKAFRFGTVNEGGVKIELASTISINAGYEAAVIYPRYMFWYWAGSTIIEEAGKGLLDHFIHKVARSSPAAGPVVNFILKNAYAYGYYLLKKDNMHWPFETAKPMTIETFKLGITFTF